MLRATRVVIDTQALRHNLETLRRANGPDTFFCPMVKANAYGHGELLVAPVIERSPGISALGVALVEEGLRLREAGLRGPILVFAPFDKVAARAMLTHRLTPVVGRPEDLAAILAVSGKASLAIHLKMNTGMNRLGFDEIELEALRATLRANPQILVEGVCTHLSHGEEVDQAEGHSADQLRRFKAMTAGFPGVRHAHKSASLGVLAAKGLPKLDPEVGARVGISIYGLPYDGETTGPGLKPVLKWTTALGRLHEIQPGESVSYGARWVAGRRSRIGVLPVGYGDGYMRSLSNRGQMLFRGRRVPVVGSVCMDYTLVDLTDVSGDGIPQPGEELVLLGSQGADTISAGHLAKLAGTIAYEIVTAIRARVLREAL